MARQIKSLYYPIKMNTKNTTLSEQFHNLITIAGTKAK